jgi:hypothetical protein
MKKRKKTNTGNKRRQKVGGQARLPAEKSMRREGADRQSRMQEANPDEQASLHPTAGPKQGRDESERKKQKQWERKQAELEARWSAAQSRQKEEDTARKRRMRTASRIAGTVLAVILCALAWYFAEDHIRIDIPAGPPAAAADFLLPADLIHG